MHASTTQFDSNNPNKHDSVTVHAKILGSTDQALLLYDGKKEWWAPLSLTKYMGNGTFTMPRWVSEKDRSQTRNESIVIIYKRAVHETDHAFMIIMKKKNKRTSIWLPKTLVEKRDCGFVMPEWLAKKKGLMD